LLLKNLIAKLKGEEEERQVLDENALSAPHAFFNSQKDKIFNGKLHMLFSYQEHLGTAGGSDAEATAHLKNLGGYVASVSESTPALDSCRKIFDLVQRKKAVTTSTDATKLDALSGTSSTPTKLGKQSQPAPCSVCLAENVKTVSCPNCQALLCQECGKDHDCRAH